MNDKLTQVDTKELELPDTLFVRDIDSKVFQTIALQAILNIEGVSILEGNLIDSFFGRDGPDRIKGIYVEQDLKNHAVTIKIEVNVAYGVALPEKADEIQNKVAHEVSRLTGLHVSCVHVVFKNLILPKQQPQLPKEEVEEKEELAYLEDFE